MEFETTQHQDPRFYYVRVKDIKQISKKFIENKQHKLILRLGDKCSQTKFFINARSTAMDDDLLRFKRQAHLFCYEPQQVMLISIGQDSKKPLFIGYSNILLTPFIELPHTKHQITVNMVFQNKDKSIDSTISAVVRLQLYFCLDFQAKIEIDPIEAHLNRNTAKYGQMSPSVTFKINQQKIQTNRIQNAGIHPKWQAYYENKNQLKLLQIVVQNILNQSQRPYIFNLNSVGNMLEIFINSYGIMGDNFDEVGKAVISLQNYGFFKNPNKQINFDQKQAISVYYGENNQIAGKLSLKFKFIFDQQKYLFSDDDYQ